MCEWHCPPFFFLPHRPPLIFLTTPLQVEGYWYCNRQNAVRMKTYNVLNSVKFDHKFVNIITPPSETPDFKPRVDWSRYVWPWTLHPATQWRWVACGGAG